MSADGAGHVPASSSISVHAGSSADAAASPPSASSEQGSGAELNARSGSRTGYSPACEAEVAARAAAHSHNVLIVKKPGDTEVAKALYDIALWSHTRTQSNTY